MSGMRVPGYQNSVDIQPQGVSETKIPMAPDAVFGGDVAKATAEFGKEGVGLGTTALAHFQQMQEWKAQEHAYGTIEKFRQARNDLLWRQDLKPFTTPDDQPIYDADHNPAEVPAGFLNRKLTQAEHSLELYRKEVTPLRDRFLNEIQHPIARKMAARYINNMIAEGDELVSKNQVNQYRAGVNKGFDSNITNEINSTAAIFDSKELNDKVSLILSTYDRKAVFNGTDSETAEKDKSKLVGMAAYNSAKSILDNTRDYAKAQGILDSMKTKMSPELYNDISDKIDAHSVRLEKTDEYTRKKIEYEKKNFYTNALANGKMNIDMIETAVNNGDITPDDADKYTKNIEDPSYRPGTNKYTYKKLSLMMEQGTGATYRDEVLKDFIGGKLSRNDFADLMEHVDPNYDTAINGKVPTQRDNAIIGGLKFIFGRGKDVDDEKVNTARQFLKKIKDTTVPDSEIFNTARTLRADSLKKQHPGLIGKEDVTNYGMNEKEGIKHYVDGATKAKADVKLEGPDKDKYGFALGEERNGYKYIGENKWKRMTA